MADTTTPPSIPRGRSRTCLSVNHFSEDFVICAGSVLFRAAPGGREWDICILHSPREGVWVLPKGRKDCGETVEDAALRETFEETGYKCEFFPCTMTTRAPLPHVNMVDEPHIIEDVVEPFAMTVRGLGEMRGTKIIWWYLTRATNGSCIEGTQTETEDFRSEFVAAAKAVEQLTFHDDREVAETCAKVEYTVESRGVRLPRHPSPLNPIVMASNPSLRDLYSPPSNQWAFVPPASSTVPKQSTTNASLPSYQWTARSAPNPTFNDLSPSLGVGELSSLDVSLLLRSLVASALLQYSSTAMAMPLEVGKLLLQIQWVPKDALTQESEDDPEEEAEALSEATHDEDTYFVEPGTLPTRYPAPKLVDDRGYMIRTSIMEDGTRPEYIVPVGSARTSLGMIQSLIGFHGEGWLSLWKGLLTSCIHDVAFANLQPFTDSVLRSTFLPSGGFYRPSPLLPIASHVLTGFLLSPLDLVRTRLIAQSSIPRYKTYRGPIHALSDILANEGGLRGVYLHPHLLIPTILETGLRSFMHVTLPAIIAPRLWLGPYVAADTHPVAWAFAEVLAGCASVLVTLPIETVRRRLQIQTRGTAKSLRACVETRPVPYNGVVDAMWHILTEERSDLPLKRPRRQRRSEKKRQEEELEVEDTKERGWLGRTGVGQLYRGLGIRLAATVIVFLLAVVGGGEDADGGWAEL